MRKFNTGATRDTDENKNDYNLAWAAGFFDGEGSTVCRRNNKTPNSAIQMTLGQKDRPDGSISESLIKFHEIVGVGNIYRKTLTGKEISMHQFYVSKRSDVRRCAKSLWPYLSETKRAQYQLAATKLKEATDIDLTI